jgi:hypothetical protein
MELCPGNRDETAEAFVLQRLTAEEMILFETHLITCDDWRQVVNSADEYIAALRAGARRPKGR